MISGYPDIGSMLPGQDVCLHVSTDAASFRVDFYRQLATLEFVCSSPVYSGVNVSEASYGVDWGWPSYSFTIPADWRSAAYIANLVELLPGKNPAPPAVTSPFGSGKVLFAVRSANPGHDTCLLFKLPLFTYHAYNDAIGSEYPPPQNAPCSLHRRGGGVSGDSHQDWADPVGSGCDTDAFEKRSIDQTLRQRFSHWDAIFLAWLESSGYRMDVCTDLDLHEDPGLLGPYTLMVSCGHDEYWSDQMRQHAETFLNAGGNIAFFGGNTCFRRIEVSSSTEFAYVGEHWPTDGENRLIGVAYRNGGGWWVRSPERPAVGYRVQHPTHWVYDGTGVQAGEIFGEAEHLIGYECDGVFFPPAANPGDPVAPDASDGTPKDFVILGVAPLQPGWVPEPREAHTEAGPNAATMGIYTRPSGGSVFNAATTDWPRVVAGQGYGEPRTVRITKNVLDRLSLRALPVIGPPRRGCSGKLAEVGTTASFHANVSKLAGASSLEYEWTISWMPPGPPSNLNQPTLTVQLPDNPELVTITVTVRTKGLSGCDGFGTISFTPLSHEDVLAINLWCRLRDLAARMTRTRKALRGVREGGSLDQWFVDPLWDPIRSEVVAAPLAGDLRAIIASAKEIQKIAGRLLALRDH